MAINALHSSTSIKKRLSQNITAGILPPTRTAKTLSLVGDTQLSTAESVFGTASGKFDGTGDYFNITNFESSAIAVSGDFTVELWAKFSILPRNQTAGGGSYMVIYFSLSGATSREPYVLITNNTSNNPQIGVGLTNGPAASYGTWTLTSTTISTGVWYHVALVRYNGTWKAYWDGVDMGNAGSTTNWPPQSDVVGILPSANWCGWPSTGRGYWSGYIDEMRVSLVARYKAAFTPPTSALVNDPGTLMLLHFDGANASTTITDDIS